MSLLQENQDNETLAAACNLTTKLIETLKEQLHLSDTSIVRTLLFHSVKHHMQTKENQQNSFEDEVGAAEMFAYLDVNKMLMG